jgi:hypothetical protein
MAHKETEQMPTNMSTIVKAANKALADLHKEESAIGLRAFNDPVAVYVKVSETFVSLDTALAAAREDKDSKWTQAAFITAAQAAGVTITSQPTVSRIMAMRYHTPQRLTAWRKVNQTARFNEYAAHLGKVARNEVKDDGTLTEAGEEAKARSDERQEKDVKARQAVTLSEFDFSGLHAPKASKKARLETLLKLQADLKVQIEALVSDLGKETAEVVAESVRKAEREAVKAVKGSYVVG